MTYSYWEDEKGGLYLGNSLKLYKYDHEEDRWVKNDFDFTGRLTKLDGWEVPDYALFSKEE